MLTLWSGQPLRFAGLAAEPVVPGRRFRFVLQGRKRLAPSLLAAAILLESQDKVSDTAAKARGNSDILWRVVLGIEMDDGPVAKSILEVVRA